MKKKEISSLIKVLLVGPIPPPYGGIPAYVKSLFDAKVDNIEFILFNTANPLWIEKYSREGKRSYGSIFEFGIWASLRKILYVLNSFISLTWFLFKYKPDIVQVFTCSYWGYWRNWVYVMISKFLGEKTIFHLLGAIDQFYDEVGSFQKYILRRTLNSADIYLMQSPGLESWAKKYSKKKVRNLWNGIDFTQIPPKSGKPPEQITSLNTPVGITIGNLSINKGTEDIIEAMAILQRDGIKISWIFVGRGDKRQYETLAAKKGLSENIHFAGEVNELEKWQLIHHANFFCLPSYAEGQPISIIEAMACGLPVISTNVGSIPEMISEGINGKLIDPGDVYALKDSILFLIKNPKVGEDMGRASQKLCQERHNIADLYLGLSKIYSQE